MRRTIIATATAALVCATAATALAGGWAVTTVDSLPAQFEAGTTHTIDYTVLAHGKTPVDAGDSIVTFQDADKNKPLTFEAINHGDGTYTVEVTLPSEGSWEWEVSHGYGAQTMGSIEVAGAAGAGLDLVDALKVILPLATLAAAAFTWREWTRGRAGAPTAESG